MVNIIRHSTIGLSVTSNISPLEKADKLLDGMPRKAHDVNNALSGIKFNTTATTNVDKFNNAYDKLDNKVNDSTNNIIKNQDRMISSSQRLSSETGRSINGLRDNLEHLSNENFVIKPKVDMPDAQLHTLHGKVQQADQRMPKLHLFRDVAGGTMAGNLLSNVVSGLTGKLKEGAAAGFEYDKSQQKMLATWTTLTGNEGKAQGMLNTVNSLSVKTGQDADLVDELEQKYYHLHSNKSESDELTKSMLNLSDAVGLTRPRIEAVSQDMVNGLSRGKANNGMLNQISQYFPMFREQLSKYETQIHHGKEVTVSDLGDMAKKGEISAKDIETVFNDLGNQKYNKAADNMLQTMYGMQRTIHARMPALIGEFEHPIMTAQNPFYGAISKWVSDKHTEHEFKLMGESTTKGINTITGAFGKAYHVKNGTKALDDATTHITHGIDTLSNGIARNAPQIKDFFSSTKTTGVDSLKLLAGVTKDVSVVALPLLKFAADHSKQVVPFMAGLFITKKVLAFGTALTPVMGMIKWIRNQFKKPISSNMSNSMMEQAGKMQTAEELSGGTSTGGGSVGLGNMSRVERNASKINRFDKFTSRFGGVAKTGTRLGKVGTTAKVAQSATKLGRFGKLAKFGGSSIAGVDVLTSLMDLQGINGKNYGGKIGATGGSLIGTGAGAALGTAIMPGLGTAVGAGVGSMASEWLGKKGGQYLQKEVPKEVHQYKKDFSWTPTDFKTTNAGPKIDTRNPFVDKNSLSSQRKSAIEKDKTYSSPVGKAALTDKVNEQAFSMSIGNFSKESKKYIQGVFNAENQAFSTYGKSRSQKLGSIYSNANNLANSSISKEQGKIGKLLKAGVITQGQASQASSSFAQKQKQMVSDVQGDLNKLSGKEHLTAKQRAKIVGNLNSNLVKLTGEGSDKQKGTLKALNGATKKLTTAQYLQIVNSSESAYKKSKHNAKLQRDSEIKEIKSSSLSASVKKQAIDNANEQYRKTLKAAEGQKTDVIQAAKDQASGVSQAVKDAGTSISDQMYALMGASHGLSNYLPSLDRKTPDVVSGKGGVTDRINSVNKISSGKVKVKSKAEQKKSINKLGFKSPFATNSFALGSGALKRNQRALVNEFGQESAWNPKKGTFRFLGKGKPMLAQLYAGEHILTAKQTRDLTHGGMHGNFKAYAGGIDGSAGNAINAKITNPNGLTKFSKQAQNIWSSIRTDTKSNTKKINANTQDDFNSMKSKALDKLNTLHDGMIKNVKSLVSDFGSIMDKLPKYADKAMSGVTGALNKGISGINSSLTQFGGNNHVLKPIHYAKGSGGKITHKHLAMVNDAMSGPRQEAIVRNNRLLYPNGKNALVALQQGDQVLNGRQTQMINAMNSIAHYAKGSGVSDDALRSIAEANAKSSGKAWNNTFGKNIKASGSSLQQGLTNNSANGTKTVGTPWSGAMWGLINSLASGGNGSKSAFLNYAMSHFSGKKYVLGASGPDAYDCSGMVASALSHFGIDIGRTTTAMQGSSGLDRIGKDIHKTQAGDIALFGHGNGAAGHVGIVNNPNQGTIFNETPPYARTTPLSYITALPLDAFYRVKGLHNTVKKTGSNMLNGLVKKQLGKKAMGWISNHLAPKFSADMTGPAPTGDHAHWLKQAGIPNSWWPATNEIITKESGWNTHAQNSSGAYGLPQALPAGKMASAGADWHDNPITQLRWYKSYVNDHYHGIDNAINFRHTHGWYANGGWANKASVFGEVPGQPEVAINPQRNTADDHIMSAINARDNFTSGGFSKRLARLMNIKNGKNERHDLFKRAMDTLNPSSHSQANSRPTNVEVKIGKIVVNGGDKDTISQNISNLIAKKVKEAIDAHDKKTYSEMGY